jgi:putative Holliday junction resolvase
MVSALGLDVGDRRIGLAGSDPTGLVATGLGTIERQSLEQDLAKLQHWIQVRRVDALILGLPRNMNGTVGQQAQKVQRFGHQLDAAFNLPIHYVDERLTTVQAKRTLLTRNISAAKRRALVDQESAVLILQQWLDQRRWQSSPAISEEPTP